LDGSAAGSTELEMRAYCCPSFVLLSPGYLIFEAKKEKKEKQC